MKAFVKGDIDGFIALWLDNLVVMIVMVKLSLGFPLYLDPHLFYARLMPAKKLSDTGKSVRCPMPGLVVSLAVAEGQEVKAGETLAVVEAMKMENILRSERDGTIKKIRVKKGDSVAVDAVIMEFA